MTQDSDTSIHEMVRKARLEKGITQSQLAALTGCRQSAVSMFEGGRTSSLSRKNLLAVGEHLGLDVKSLQALDLRNVGSRGMTAKYCPVGECPSNIPYLVRGQLHYLPTMVEAPAAERTRCVMCGDLLEDRCPNEDCRAAVSEGGVCSRCGTAYVTVSEESQERSEEWADRIRARISSIRSLSMTRHFEGGGRRLGRADYPVDSSSGGEKNNVEDLT